MHCCSALLKSSVLSRSPELTLHLLPQVRKAINWFLFGPSSLQLYFPSVRLQTAPPRTPCLLAARKGKRIEDHRSGASVRLPSSSLRTSPRPRRTGSRTPSTARAWSAGGSGSPWSVVRTTEPKRRKINGSR